MDQEPATSASIALNISVCLCVSIAQSVSTAVTGCVLIKVPFFEALGPKRGQTRHESSCSNIRNNLEFHTDADVPQRRVCPLIQHHF